MNPEESEPEFEGFLRNVPGERPAPDRREEARRAFLASGGASHAAGKDRMGSRMAFDPQAFDEHRLHEHDGFVDWLAARAPAAAPRPEARQRARLAFLSAVAADVSTAPLRRERRSVRALVLALAAAAILAVTFLLPKPERWEVRLDGPLRFAERDFVPGEDARLAAALQGSGTLETTLAGARFSLGSELVLELSAGASLSFPPLPELDGIAPIDFELTRGEAYVRTSAGYPGNPIVVRTAFGDVGLNGTVVGVLVGEFGTCVCVAEGTVSVTSTRLPGGTQEVGPHTTLRVAEDPGVRIVVEAFPEGDGEAAEHTRALVEFARGP